MKLKTTLGITVAMFAVQIIPLCGAEIQSPDRQPAAKAAATTPAHERAVAALSTEQRKLAAGKSTLFNVCQVGKDLRTVELQLSTSSAQRIAAHKRHVAAVQKLKEETDQRIEKGVVAPLDGKLVAQELKEAEAALLRAERGTN